MRPLLSARWHHLPLLAILLAAAPLQAQSNGTAAQPAAASRTSELDAILAAEGYLKPPPLIERAVLAPRHLQVNLTNLSPSGRYFVSARSPGQPKLADLGKHHHNLGGWFIDPAANRSRTLTTRYDVGLDLLSWADGRSVQAQLPRGATVTGARWSPAGDQVGFLVHTETATHIYVADPANGRVRQVTRTPLLATHITNFEWTADGEHVVAVLLPANRGPEPVEGLASTPKVRVAQEGQNRLRTYNDLLETPHEFQLVEYYSTGQLARINVRNGQVRNIGQPAMIRSVSPSPDGRYFRVSVIQKPFSYLVPIGNFGSIESLWDESGQAIGEPLARVALREGQQAQGGGGGQGGQGGQDAGRRSLSWRADGPGMWYLQRDPAPQGGAQGQQAQGQSPRLDRLIYWLPPFSAESIETVYTTENQITQVRFSDDGQLLVITENEGNNRQHTFVVQRSDTNTKFTVNRTTGGGGGRGAGAGGAAGAAGAAAAQNTGPTGTLMMMRGTSGLQVVRLSSDGQHLFLTGSTGAAAEESDDPDNAEQREAPRPTIDKLNFRTGAVTRIFEGSPSYTESVSAILDNDVTQIVLQRQTSTMVPQSILKNLVTGEERQLTNNEDFTPAELKGVQRVTFDAKRVDGLDVRVRVTLPAGYREGDKLPAIFWFYPREYTSFEAYRRTVGGAPGAADTGPGRYPTFAPGSVQLFVLLGYAVVEPDAPIIGPEGRMNDNYVHDLRNNLSAVIDELDRRGIADRTRLAIGGHSYGGFSTMNAMVHTPYFKAGISGAGNSNRLLTPLGFQSERRDLWEARDTYLQMSALLNAHQMTGALLLYHGMEDQNVGTNPMNSERMFHALNGLGKTAALYMYPFEDHGQIAEETRLDMWARWAAWLDKYVKGDAPARAVTEQDERLDGSR